jgi:hypothetical protein
MDKTKLKSFLGRARTKIVIGLASSGILVSTVAAEDINWTQITSILDGVATSLFPSLVTLITAAVPIIIVVTIVGFVVGFLDKILDLLKLR